MPQGPQKSIVTGRHFLTKEGRAGPEAVSTVLSLTLSSDGSYPGSNSSDTPGLGRNSSSWPSRLRNEVPALQTPSGWEVRQLGEFRRSEPPCWEDRRPLLAVEAQVHGQTAAASVGRRCQLRPHFLSCASPMTSTTADRGPAWDVPLHRDARTATSQAKHIPINTSQAGEQVPVSILPWGVQRSECSWRR